MFKKIKKAISDAKVALAVGMSNVDKEIMNGTFTQTPESSKLMSPAYSRNGFLRSTQLGQMKEEQLLIYNRFLDIMDQNHGKTKIIWVEMVVELLDDNENVVMEDGKPVMVKKMMPFATPMTPEEVEEQEIAKQMMGDIIEGYQTKLFIKNKDFLYVDATNLAFDVNNSDLTEKEKADWNYTGQIYRPTMILTREFFGLKGGVKLEDFATEVFIKEREDFNPELDRDVILELYCVNYNWRQKQIETDRGFIPEGDEVFHKDLVYNKVLEGLNATVDISGITLIQHTATRNNIIHEFDIVDFKEIKKYKKGFVIKFNALKK